MDSTSYTPYKLSIRLQSDGFSLSVYDSELAILTSKSGEINLLKINEEELVQEFKHLFETDINCDNVELILDNEFYTIIPDFFGDVDIFVALMRFQHPEFESNNSVIYSKQFVNLKTNLIFSCPLKLKNAINKTFTKVTILHAAVELLDRANNNGIFVALGSTKIDLAVVSENKLQLLNSYTFSSNEDILYHLLNIMYTLKLQAEMRELKIFTHQNRPELQNLLVKHIPNTTIIQLKN